MSHIGYPSYKDTGTSWLGAIPNHWDIKPLWSMFKRQKRTGHQSERLLSVYRDYGVIPKDSRDDNANKASEDLSTYQLVKSGDLAINKMKAWQGSVAISTIQGIVSPAYFIFTPTHHALPKYLHYLFRCARYIAGYLAISKGVRVGQWDMDPDYHSRMPVVIPPRKEQEEIADFLDRETSRIDSLIEKKTRFIELLKEKRQAVITNAVTRGLDRSAAMRTVNAGCLDVVVSNWKICPLKSVADVELSNVDKKSIDGEPEVFLCNYVDVYKNEKITPRINFMRATASHQQIQRLRLMLGDVLLTKDSESPDDIGVPSLVAENTNAVCGYHLALARPKKYLLSGGFLAWFLRSHNAKAYFETEAKGMTRYGIDKSSLKDTPICLPPLDEQIAITSFLDRETARVDALSEKTKRSIELLKEHRSALITAAVTGKIDVRNSK